MFISLFPIYRKKTSLPLRKKLFIFLPIFLKMGCSLFINSDFEIHVCSWKCWIIYWKVAKIWHFWNLWLNREGWRMIWDSDQRIPHGSRVRKKLTKIFENILRTIRGGPTYLTNMISCLIWYLCDQWIQAELEGFIQLHLLVWLYFGDCLFKSKNKAAKIWEIFLLF